MDRKEFLAQVGFGAAALLLPACLGSLASCSSNDVSPMGGKVTPPTNIDFAVDVSTGPLSTNGGFLVTNGIIVARTIAGSFLAVSAACTHQGTNVQYRGADNDFLCPNHGSIFSATGQVTNGPASRPLIQYKTTLTGTSLRVFS